MKLTSLREARRKRGWTQDQLADASGVDQTTISRLETESNPNPTELTKERLANALGIAPPRLQFVHARPSQTLAEACDRVGHSAAKAS